MHTTHQKASRCDVLHAVLAARISIRVSVRDFLRVKRKIEITHSRAAYILRLHGIPECVATMATFRSSPGNSIDIAESCIAENTWNLARKEKKLLRVRLRLSLLNQTNETANTLNFQILLRYNIFQLMFYFKYYKCGYKCSHFICNKVI